MAQFEGLYVYELNPMDFGWEGMQPVDQYRTRLKEEVAHYDPKAIDQFEEFYNRALSAGKQLGWEGDFRAGTGPHVAALPDHDSALLMLVWKQDNNGTTFVASQARLAHLEQK